MSFDELDMKQQVMNQGRGSVLAISGRTGSGVALLRGLMRGAHTQGMGLHVFLLFSFVDLCL